MHTPPSKHAPLKRQQTQRAARRAEGQEEPHRTQYRRENNTMNNIKSIIREVPAEQAELSFYFDGDCFRDYDGNHFNYNLFIIQHGYYGRIDGGLNIEDYKSTQERAERIIDGFADPEYNETADPDEVITDYDGNPITYEMIMDDENISHDKRDALIAWYKADPDTNNTDDIAEFLTITTGEKWSTTSAHGYCQGDYCEVVYCEAHYTQEQAQTAGEVYEGAAKEFCVIELDEDGEEADSCYGFIVADCQIKSWMDAEQEYKRIVSEWACIDPEETQLEMIDYNKTVTRTIYSYRTIEPKPMQTTNPATLPKAAHTTSAKTH